MEFLEWKRLAILRLRQYGLTPFSVDFDYGTMRLSMHCELADYTVLHFSTSFTYEGMSVTIIANARNPVKFIISMSVTELSLNVLSMVDNSVKICLAITAEQSMAIQFIKRSAEYLSMDIRNGIYTPTAQLKQDMRVLVKLWIDPFLSEQISIQMRTPNKIGLQIPIQMPNESIGALLKSDAAVKYKLLMALNAVLLSINGKIDAAVNAVWNLGLLQHNINAEITSRPGCDSPLAIVNENVNLTFSFDYMTLVHILLSMAYSDATVQLDADTASAIATILGITITNSFSLDSDVSDGAHTALSLSISESYSIDANTASSIRTEIQQITAAYNLSCRAIVAREAILSDYDSLTLSAMDSRTLMDLEWIEI